jgi:hypothetical protein
MCLCPFSAMTGLWLMLDENTKMQWALPGSTSGKRRQRTQTLKGTVGMRQLSKQPISALMLQTPTFQPLITTTQMLWNQKDTTQKRSDHVVLRPKSGWIVHPLQPQKVCRSVTVEHCIPLIFLDPIVCDTASLIPPHSLALLLGPWALSTFFPLFAC